MKKFGSQTLTQSVILGYSESRYQEAVNIYEKTKLKAYEWQINLLKAIMEVDVDEDNLWVHQKFGYSVSRRNGKTEVVYMLELWALHEGLNILHTAHRISTSHSSFERVKEYLS